MPLTARQLGRRLASLREARGLSQRALAERARISREYLLRVEAGRYDITVSVLQRLAKALGVSVAELLG